VRREAVGQGEQRSRRLPSGMSTTDDSQVGQTAGSSMESSLQQRTQGTWRSACSLMFGMVDDPTCDCLAHIRDGCVSRHGCCRPLGLCAGRGHGGMVVCNHPGLMAIHAITTRTVTRPRAAAMVPQRTWPVRGMVVGSFILVHSSSGLWGIATGRGGLLGRIPDTKPAGAPCRQPGACLTAHSCPGSLP
jgi:hypothetical protein